MIETFNGKFAFLSNFHASVIVWNSKEWPTAEHFYQAAKTNDVDDKERIRMASSPGRAKRMGRRASPRSNWEEIKFGVMLKIVRLKFEQNPHLLKKLLATGRLELIEGNTWHDNVWGNCNCHSCKEIIGQNMLGKILMQVREASK